MSTAVWISYRFSDDDQITVQAETDAPPHPDLLDQVKRAAIEAYREALGVSVETLGGEE